MSSDPTTEARIKVDELYRSESRQVLATLIRLLGDFDRAEDALREAFAVAMESQPTHVPGSSPPGVSKRSTV